MTVPDPESIAESVADEFGLGPVVEAAPIPGRPDVVKLTAERGVYLVKPAIRAPAVDLYERVARTLRQAGIRQAGAVRAPAGGLVSRSGHVVQEFLPGQAVPRPTRRQTLAAMRHIARYHAALGPIGFPAELRDADTVWTRVALPEYLCDALPRLIGRLAPFGDSASSVPTAVGLLEEQLSSIRSLSPQLVHGDIGPDNVLMDGDDVVAIVDFTPFHEPVLFAVATAVYWYHVYGHGHLDPAAIAASVAAAGPWTDAESEVWPAMLLREALRRLATPLALAVETGAPVSASAGHRLAAVTSITDAWPDLVTIAR